MRSLEKYYFDTDTIQPLVSILNRTSRISLRVIDWFVTNYAKKHNISYYLYTTPEGNVYSIAPPHENMYPNLRQFIVFLSYKAQLKAYSKKQFDPFCRQSRITFRYNSKDHTLVSTVGQLNFFRWAIDNKIIQYVEDHIEEIEADMNETLSVQPQNDVEESEEKEEITMLKSVSKNTIRRTSSRYVSERIHVRRLVGNTTKGGSSSDTMRANSRGREGKTRRRRHELSIAATKTINKHDMQITVSFD